MIKQKRSFTACGHIEDGWCIPCVVKLWMMYEAALAGCRAASPWIMSTSPWGEATVGKQLDEIIELSKEWKPKGMAK